MRKQSALERTDRLYKQHKKYSERKDKSNQEYDYERSMGECTFQPNVKKS